MAPPPPPPSHSLDSPWPPSLLPSWLLRRWWMSPRVRSEEDTLQFDHLKEPEKRARMSIGLSFDSAYGALTHTTQTRTRLPSEIRASSQQEQDREALLLNLPALCYLLLTPFRLAPGQWGAMHLTREIREGAVACSPRSWGALWFFNESSRA